MTQEKANQHQALKSMHLRSVDGGSQEETREGGGGRERRKRQRRECDRVVMEGRGGGTLNLLEEEVWRKGLGKTERGVSLT